MDLTTQLKQLRDEGLGAVQEATELKQLNEIRVHFLGKKGPITAVLRGMKEIDPAERPQVGKFANEVRDALQQAIATKQDELETAQMAAKLEKETLDVTLPGTPVKSGTPHVLQQIIDEIEELFLGMGYQVVNGPEVEEEHYNFEMMNLP